MDRIVSKMSKSHERVWSRGVDRSFSREELEKFLRVIENDKQKTIFMLMAYTGLRVGECARVHISDLSLSSEHPQIRIENIKTKVIDHIDIIPKMCKVLEEYIETRKEKIEWNEGYIFYTTRFDRRGHMSENVIRVLFREYAIKAGLNDTYYTIQAVGNQKAKKDGTRTLHRLSCHSLRHFYGTSIWNQTKDLVKLQKLMRHRNLKSTQVYVNHTQKELRDTMLDVFESEELLGSRITTDTMPPETIRLAKALWEIQKSSASYKVFK